jgi:hypothetical protein
VATRTIETQAIISAKDRTGNTFAQVATKLKQLEEQSKNMSKRASEASRASSRQAQAAVVQAASGPAFARNLMAATTAVAASHAIRTVTQRVIQQAASEQHEQMRMAVSGMSGSEQEHATKLSRELQSKYAPIGQTNIMHMLRNARSVVGSYEEATHILDPLLKLRVVAQGAQPHAAVEQINEDFDKLVKGLEIKGVTQNLPQFERYINGMAKALNLFGDTLKPYEYYQMFKYGRASTLGLSEKYALSVAPTLAQELGGSSAGKAQAAFYSAIIGGKMTNVAAGEFVKLGMVAPDQIVKTKTGSVKGIKPGGIAGSELARTNPYEWVQKYLLPAMLSHGVTGEAKQAELIAHLFGNQVAAQLVQIFATQQKRIEKDMGLVGQAKGVEAVADVMNTLDSATKSLHNSLDSLAMAMGRPFIQPLTASVNTFAGLIDKLAKKLDTDPVLAAATTAATLGTIGVGTGALVAGGHAMWTGSPLMPVIARAGLRLGVGGGVLGTAWALGEAEYTTQQIREKMRKDPNWIPPTSAIPGMQADRTSIQGQIFQRQMAGQGPDPFLQAADAALDARINRSMAGQYSIQPGLGKFGFGNIRGAGFDTAGGRRGMGAGGFPMTGYGGMGGGNEDGKSFQPIAQQAIRSAAEKMMVQLDPASKVDVQVGVSVTPSSALLEVVQEAKKATAEGNAKASVSAGPGGVGKTGVGDPGSPGHGD